MAVQGSPPSGAGQAPDAKVKLGKTPRAPIVVHVHGWYPMLVMAVVLVVITAFSIIYTNNVDDRREKAEREARNAVIQAERKADQRWCSLMVLLDNAYADPNTPPTTELGKKVAAAIHEIRLSLNC